MHAIDYEPWGRRYCKACGLLVTLNTFDETSRMCNWCAQRIVFFEFLEESRRRRAPHLDRGSSEDCA